MLLKCVFTVLSSYFYIPFNLVVIFLMARIRETVPFTFWGENALNHLRNAFSRVQNTPSKSREGNILIFSKEEQTIVSYGRFFHKTFRVILKECPFKAKGTLLMLNTELAPKFWRWAGWGWGINLR